MSELEELPLMRACPFCGYTDLAVTDGYVGDTIDYFATCLVCDSTGPWRETRREAVEAWNKRAGER